MPAAQVEHDAPASGRNAPGAKLRRQRSRTKVALLAPLTGYLLLLFALPVLVALAVGFLTYDPAQLVRADPTIGNYSRFLGDAFYRDSIYLTFGIAVGVTVAAIVFGYPIAYQLHLAKGRTARIVLSMIVFLPLMLSLVVTSFAWLIILGERGPISWISQTAGGPSIRLHGTVIGVSIVMVYQYVPYFVLNVFASLENIDSSVVRAARSLGASPTVAFWRIVFPQSIPGVVSGALLVFALTIGSFVTPIIIGLGQVKTLPVFIYNFAIFIFDWPGASALAGIVIVLSLAATYLLGRTAQRLFMQWVE